MMVPMSKPPNAGAHARRPEPTHRSRRPRRSFLGVPRWGLILGAMLVCVGVTFSVVAKSPWTPDTITRAIDPAGIQPGPEPVAQESGEVEAADPSLAAHLTQDEVVVAPKVRRVQDSITPDTGLPADSGSGRRVVYSEGLQRVWLVDESERVETSYAVSGSAYDNLDPGTFEVYSRSEHAASFDGASTMDYFVRFTKGPTGAAIGFHDIPMLNSGEPIQTEAELGQPLSHGCIRQATEDAQTLWDFAPIGTTVVVTP